MDELLYIYFGKYEQSMEGMECMQINSFLLFCTLTVPVDI